MTTTTTTSSEEERDEPGRRTRASKAARGMELDMKTLEWREGLPRPDASHSHTQSNNLSLLNPSSTISTFNLFTFNLFNFTHISSSPLCAFMRLYPPLCAFLYGWHDIGKRTDLYARWNMFSEKRFRSKFHFDDFVTITLSENAASRREREKK